MKALVLSSGGVDSTTALALAVSRYGKDNVIALSVSYGQKHDKEIQAAKAVSAFYGVEQLFLDLSKIFQYSNCSLLQQSTEEIPEESYARQIEKTEGEKPVSTYVPFRNGLFLSSAASIALSKDCSVILYGAHADDSTTKGNADKLKAAIANDSEGVINFFSQLSQNLYSTLGNKLRTSNSMSSYMSVYNDKEMATQYSEYNKKISDQETKISTWEEIYYKKFSRMESALAALNAQSSSISGLFG